MDLSIYNEKHIRATDVYGRTHIGVADYYDACYCQHEYGEDEDAVIIDGALPAKKRTGLPGGKLAFLRGVLCVSEC